MRITASGQRDRVESRPESQTRIVFIVLVLVLVLLILIFIFIFIHCSIEKRMKIKIKIRSGQKRRLDKDIKLMCHCLVVCPPTFPSCVRQGLTDE
jgi:hypothetical protein